MRSYTFSVCALALLLALVSMPLGSRAFIGTGQINKIQPKPLLSQSGLLPKARHSIAHERNLVLQAKQSNDNSNPVFAALATERDNIPNQGNFFYNDEVISHLYGYMYLVGFFAAQDALFLGNFLVLSSITAWATQESILPCNPRIPAVTAAITLALTLLLRYGVGFEPPLEGLIDGYQGPTESAAIFELVICLLNIGWGFFGTWRTKEQVNGATYGF